MDELRFVNVLNNDSNIYIPMKMKWQVDVSYYKRKDVYDVGAEIGGAFALF